MFTPWNTKYIPLGPTPCNVYPVKSERYFTGACPARPVECETYSSGVGQDDRTGVESKAYFTRELLLCLVSQNESGVFAL